MTMAMTGSGAGEKGDGQAGASPTPTPPAGPANVPVPQAAPAPEPQQPPAAATADANITAPVPPAPSASSSLEDRTRISDRYHEIRKIGDGAYGTVYFARERGNMDRAVALKKIRITLTEDGVPVSAIREISLLKQLERFEHPNIVRLLDVCQGSVEQERRLTLVLVLEYVSQDLYHYLRGCPSPGLDQARIKSLIHQILCGVDFLHSNRIIHRDLKPQNILVENGRVKITDFGLARIYDFNMRLTTMVVTLWYRAPEILLSTSYATPVDVWSCGCIFGELYRRTPLFDGHNEGDQLRKIFHVIGTPHEREWPQDVSLVRSNFRNSTRRPVRDVVPEITDDAADLLQKMLTFEPSERISAAAALRHPYFWDLNAPRIMATSNRSTPTQQVLSPSHHHNHHHHHPRHTPPSPSSGPPASTPVRQAALPTQITTNDENNPNAGNSANTNAILSRAPEPKVTERNMTAANTSTNVEMVPAVTTPSPSTTTPTATSAPSPKSNTPSNV